MSAGPSANRDGEWLYKKWRDGLGAKVEDAALRRILRCITKWSVHFASGEECDFGIAVAVRDAMLFAWEAGWAAAGGDDDSEG